MKTEIMNSKIHRVVCLLFAVYCLSLSHSSAQVGINTTGAAAHSSAMLDVSDTARGTLIPRLTTAQRDAIVSPAQSLLIYNTTTKCFQMYENTFWQSVFCTSCLTPPAPTAGAHVPSDFQIVWNWNAVSQASGYKWNTVNDYATATNVGTSRTYTQTGLSCATSYTLYVWAYYACGTNSSVATLTATTTGAYPSQPSVITGTSPVCKANSAVSYSVTNVAGNTYSWTYSGTGFTCASGCTANAITADFSGSATSGTLTCTPFNTCGAGTARSFSVTVNSDPTTANAGPNQTNVPSPATLSGNVPVVGSGTWSIVSGTGGNITTPTSPTSTFTGTANTTYVLRWTISNPPCTASTSDVTIALGTPSCIIGNSPANGGYIFLNSGGKCYVVATSDQSPGAVWGCNAVNVAGAMGTAVGTGQANTTAIVNACGAGTPAKICDDLVLNGYSDWFLPSKDEFSAMRPYVSLSQGITWTSSQVDANYAWSWWYASGYFSVDGIVSYFGKTTSGFVRCVRAF